MLETIYEVDENLLVDEDPSKSTNQQSRLSIYMCWCMITGCFLILTFIIMISLNPHYLINNPMNKNTQNLRNLSFHPAANNELSAEIINYLGIFSYEINKQLDLELHPILFLTSSISNSSSESPDQHGLLWIYGHLKYPSACLDHSHCRETFHFKLKRSFTELSSFINTIGVDSTRNRRIQLDWCDLIENSTAATFVSLVSITMINQNSTETTKPSARPICDDPEQNMLLSKTMDELMAHEDVMIINPNSPIADEQTITPMTDTNNNSIRTSETICDNPSQCAKHSDDIESNQPKENTHCPNDTGTQYLLMSNSF